MSEETLNVALTRGRQPADRRPSDVVHVLPGRSWPQRHRRAAADGVPEPLQFALNDGVRLMLVPADGFGWVIGDHEVAQRGHSECVLSLVTETQTGVDELIKRAQQAGADIVTEPAQQPWGYAGAFADPDGHVWMVTPEPVPS